MVVYSSNAVFNNAFACLNSVPSGGELYNRLRSKGVVWLGVQSGSAIGVVVRFWFSSTVIGEKGHNPVTRNLLDILRARKALSLARAYIRVHSSLDNRPRSRVDLLSVSVAKARFRGPNRLTSRG